MKHQAGTLMKIAQKSNWRCFYCGKFLLGEKLEYDHFIPRSICNHDRVHNLVISCPKCNRIKHNNSIEIFKQSLKKHYGFTGELFFEKYGIEISEEATLYTKTLNEEVFTHYHLPIMKHKSKLQNNG